MLLTTPNHHLIGFLKLWNITRIFSLEEEETFRVILNLHSLSKLVKATFDPPDGFDDKFGYDT